MRLFVLVHIYNLRLRQEEDSELDSQPGLPSVTLYKAAYFLLYMEDRSKRYIYIKNKHDHIQTHM
jgi:hypothetical protein